MFLHYKKIFLISFQKYLKNCKQNKFTIAKYAKEENVMEYV